MSPVAGDETRRRDGRRGVWLALAAAGLLIVALANAHLVYVAFGSQPDCVPHAKSAGEAGGFRAARSVC